MTTLDVQKRAFAVEIRATTEVNAPAERVWEVLTDGAAYPQWNPFIKQLDGSIEVGEQLEVTLHPEGGKPTVIKPKVVDVAEGRAFEWLGRVGLPGLLDGWHRFEVVPLDGNRSRLVQSERLAGVLVPGFRSMLTEGAPRSFVAMNDALAARVSNGA